MHAKNESNEHLRAKEQLAKPQTWYNLNAITKG